MTHQTETPWHLIVALGASNTAGYGVSPEQAYPAVVERLLRARGWQVEVRNAGISGHTTAEMLARLVRDIPSAANVVLFQPGSNDTRTGVSNAERERNIAIIQGKLAARGIAVVRVAAAFEAARPGSLQADSIHFTARGHELVGTLLLDAVIAALNGLGAPS